MSVVVKSTDGYALLPGTEVRDGHGTPFQFHTYKDGIYYCYEWIELSYSHYIEWDWSAQLTPLTSVFRGPLILKE